jgi:hypothetical protein
VAIAHKTLRDRFIFQSGGLKANPGHHPEAIESVVARIGIDGTGFQLEGAVEPVPGMKGGADDPARALALTIDNGLVLKQSGKGANTHADFIEIPEEDVAADELQTVLDWAKPLVQHNDPGTNDPLNVIMTIGPGEFGFAGAKLQAVTVNVTFSEPVAHSPKPSLQVSDGHVSNFSGSGQTYSFLLTRNAPFVTATVNIPRGTVHAHYHPNRAAPPFTFESVYYSKNPLWKPRTLHSPIPLRPRDALAVWVGWPASVLS